MDLSTIVIKNLDRESINSLKAFAEAVNSKDNLEISIPEQALEFMLSNEELRKGINLAFLDDKLIGFASIFRNMSKPEDANFELIIHPDCRFQGLGGMLYDMILEQGQKNGVKNVNAYAKESMQQSVDFAKKRGFEPIKYSWKMDLDLSNENYRKIPTDICNIRRINYDDHKDYIDIMNAGFKKPGEDLYTEKSFEMNLKDPDTYVFFVEKDAKTAATAAIRLEKDISRGYIHNVTVYSEFRGQGLGEITLNHCINIIKEAGLSKASLNVYGDNKNALSLYKKLGFAEMDTHITFKREI